MKTFVFPGQGSQAKGMGEALFDEFSELTAKADSILGYSIKQLCVEDPDEVLGQTQFTQPALYVVNALSYYKAIAEEGQPDFVAGHSLGEFNALLAAQVFDFETGLKLVKRRGELMSQASGGGMAAIVNATEADIIATLTSNGFDQVELANYNTPSQIVVSGPKDQIVAAAEFFKVGRVRYLPLKTSGAFHSSLMKDAGEHFATYLNDFTLADPSITVIANINAQPYESGQVAAGLAKQITHSVHWTRSIQYLLTVDGEMEFKEIGNGQILTKLIRDIRKQMA